MLKTPRGDELPADVPEPKPAEVPVSPHPSPWLRELQRIEAMPAEKRGAELIRLIRPLLPEGGHWPIPSGYPRWTLGQRAEYLDRTYPLPSTVDEAK